MHDSYKMLSFYCYYIKIMLGLFGLIISAAGIAGMADSRYALIMDYENGGEIINFSAPMLAFGLTIIFSVFLPTHLAAPLTAITTIITIVILCAMNWFFQYGHVPGLDVLYRDYDLNNVCWTGIIKIDRNSVDNSNCFIDSFNKLELLCAQCRQEYYQGEQTFLKSRRFSVALIPILLLLAQLAHLYLMYLKTTGLFSRTKSIATTEISLNESQSADTTNKDGAVNGQDNVCYLPAYSTQETYIDFKDDIYDDEFDHYDVISKNIYANCNTTDATKPSQPSVIETDGYNKKSVDNTRIYYAVPKNNMPVWKYYTLRQNKPTAPSLSLLQNENSHEF
ncbi:ARIF-1 [Rachiplusia nu nucleopolyhedrovirus]|uniref:ARIF-1 n=1 Tax=Rachiplusia nu nucleopolyhedrovirus TaxID=2605775 RepID=A0AAE6IQV2_9ABAC|nr:ARIF-1 [Rachiplusia nu nucleopolyhedrovirus]QEI03705.1 ARIF-1 [Rachiplusia nu nucleopolyhedrovirus]